MDPAILPSFGKQAGAVPRTPLRRRTRPSASFSSNVCSPFSMAWERKPSPYGSGGQLLSRAIYCALTGRLSHFWPLVRCGR